MKKIIILLSFCLIHFITKAQAPQGIPYQSVIRNSNGDLINNQSVHLRFSIHDSSMLGTIVYQESHTATTTNLGMVTLSIGQGTPVVGSFSAVNWGSGAKFLQVELDAAGGNNYIDLGTQQMMSVPYALYAVTSGSHYLGALPVVQTLNINNIKYTSAIVSANLINNNGKIILAKGICYSTSPNPTEANSVYVPNSNLGNYIDTLSNLTPNTLYYVRAFAVSTAGTAYGTELSFTTLPLSVPTLITDTLSNISNQSVFATASITDDGGSNITERGFCLSTSSMPTINDIKIQVTSTALSYNSSITSLQTNTTYYIRAYAINSQGVNYGNQQVFTTISLPLPTLITTSSSNLSYTSVTLGGQISSDGGTAITQRGVCYGTSPNPTINQIIANSGVGMGTYSLTINNLNPNTTYYARAYASSLAGTAYGNEVAFTTLAITTPDIATFNVAGIGGTTANSGGNITNTGGSIVTARGLCWSTNPNPTINESISSNGNGLGTYTAVITGLTLNTTYYVRAYATNAQGTAYGNEVSFTTLSQIIAQPTIPILGSSLISKTNNSYVGGGFISSDGGAQILQQGICWNATGNPSVQDSIIDADTLGLGYFSVPFNLPNTCNTTYYVRAFAINSIGIGYGQQTTVSSGLVPTFGQFNVTNQSSSNGLVNATISSEILSDGGCSIIERGFCWAVTPNPSLDQFHKIFGNGTGIYSGFLDSLISNTTYYVRPYVKTSNGTYYGNQSSFLTIGITGLAIGHFYGGGIVFYIDSTGQHGLVCTPTYIFGPTPSNSGNPWGCNGTLIGGTSTTIGSGAQNTALIIGVCSESGIAARVCNDLVFNGYSDWFLPAIDELKMMNLLAVNNTIVYDPWWQWYCGNASSSENGSNTYWSWFFGYKGAEDPDGGNQLIVRAKDCSPVTFAVRSF